MVDDFAALQAKLATLRTIFRPSSPTDDRNLFRGRMREIESVMAGLQEIGQHVVVYGERGVGKTSLSFVARGLFQVITPGAALAIRLQCYDGDDFTAVWKGFFRSFRVELEKLDQPSREAVEDLLDRVETLLVFPDSDRLTPDIVADALQLISSRVSLLVVLDEFDRLGGWQNTIPFADLIKFLSDSLIPMTLLIVGVADNIDGLIQGHQSVARNLRQVAMPRMTEAELSEIVSGGYLAYSEKTGDSLESDQTAPQMIARIAQGFPYYAHLLGGAAGARAIHDGRRVVDRDTVYRAMVDAIDDASQTIRSLYSLAVSGRSDAKLAPTLLACALAKTDDTGWFSSTNVAYALSELTNVRRGAAHVNSHLKRFTTDPTWVLEERRLGPRGIRYRFHDPLMKPFIIIRAIQSGEYEVSDQDEASPELQEPRR